MEKSWKKYRLWITLSGFFVFISLVVFFGINPLVAQIRDISDEIQKKTIDNEIAESRIAKIPEMRNNYEIFAQENSRLEVILVKDKEVDFIKKLEALAGETGNIITLKIADSSPKSKQPTEVKEKNDPEDIRENLPSSDFLTMQITLRGNYVNFLNFLNKLENFDYYINVLSLDLTKSSEENIKISGSDIFSNQRSAGQTVASEKEILQSILEIAVYIKE